MKTKKELLKRIAYLEKLIADGDEKELANEAKRLKGIPVAIEKDSDIRFLTKK
jgi:hypothetical protein